MRSTILVIGKTSNIASDFIRRHCHTFNILTSSRDPADPYRIDLSSYQYLPLLLPLDTIDYALICASIVNIASCEKNYAEAELVNYVNTIRLVNDLNSCGIKSIFLSSSAVFSDISTVNYESSRCEPSTNYGLLKYKVENKVIESPLNTIVRTTKIFSPYNPLLRSWKQDLLNGAQIYAFDDLFVSPLPLSYFSNYLRDLILNNLNGIFHVSPSQHLTYYSIARNLATYLSIDKLLVKPIPATSVLRGNFYSPKKAYLDCSYTFSKAYHLDECLLEIFTELSP